MTSYDKIVNWQVNVNPTFENKRDRFYYVDLNETFKKTQKIKLRYPDEQWKYTESRYLCNLIDATILDIYFSDFVNRYYVNFNIGSIPDICGLCIAGNPNLDDIVKELSEHYDKRGFYNMINIEKTFNILYNKQTDNYVLGILFFEELPTNPKTEYLKILNDGDAEEFHYKSKLLYMKINSDEYKHISSQKNYYYYDESVLNDKTYRFVIDRPYMDIMFPYLVLRCNVQYRGDCIFYCYDTPIFTLDKKLSENDLD